MVSATSIGKLKIQDRGDDNWDTATEANLNRLEEMIASRATISTTGGDTVLSTTDYIANESRRAVLHITGTLASNAVIQIPAPSSAKVYLVLNEAALGAFTVSIRLGAAGDALTIAQSVARWFVATPTDLYYVSPSINMGSGRALASSSSYDNFDAINRLTLQLYVVTLIDKDLDTPPVSPSYGDCYHLGSSPTGAWAGQAGKIARYSDQGGGLWLFSTVPTEGMMAWVVDEGKLYISDGGTLTDVVGAGGIADGAVTAAKLASNAVETAKINASAVTTAKIADANVTAAKLASDVFASESVAKTQTSTTVAVAPANVKHAAFPAGTVMIFRQETAPTGWTKVTSSVNDKALRVTSGTPADGGALDFSAAFGSARSLSGTVGNTTLDASQIPAHYHLMFKSGVSSTAALDSSNHPATQANFGSNFSYQIGGAASTPDAGQSATSGGGSAHTHTLSMNALAMDVKFIDVILATKDSP